ncbi:hypothetical protein [Reichenbachiella sp. MALMAid0571]|uniref:hypothetical protein n=1 Tax=Reichenbachiella sp. MALMAid0571 TaxID=3143939 RepID=UPI0032DFDB81
MTEQQEVSQSIQLISNHFSIADQELTLEENTFDSLEKKLTSIVSYLLDKDMNRLLNSLYRIDLDESVFKKILTEEPPENLSRRIAGEIIKRELQKVKTREKYKAQ